MMNHESTSAQVLETPQTSFDCSLKNSETIIRKLYVDMSRRHRCGCRFGTAEKFSNTCLQMRTIQPIPACHSWIGTLLSRLPKHIRLTPLVLQGNQKYPR